MAAIARAPGVAVFADATHARPRTGVEFTRAGDDETSVDKQTLRGFLAHQDVRSRHYTLQPVSPAKTEGEEKLPHRRPTTHGVLPMPMINLAKPAKGDRRRVKNVVETDAYLDSVTIAQNDGCGENSRTGTTATTSLLSEAGRMLDYRCRRGWAGIRQAASIRKRERCARAAILSNENSAVCIISEKPLVRAIARNRKSGEVSREKTDFSLKQCEWKSASSI